MMQESSLTQDVYDCLRSDLLGAKFRPGDRLKISSICADLGVSLGAVREALSRLTAEGLVVMEPQKGFSVAPISWDELHDLTQVRSDIEGQCLRRAIAAGGIAWEAGIVAAFHEWSRTVDSAWTGFDANAARAHAAFHRALVSACDSAWLLKLRELLFAQSERYRLLHRPVGEHGRDLVLEHRELMEAALARDADRTVRLVSEHFDATTRLLVLGDVVAPRAPAARRGRLAARPT